MSYWPFRWLSKTTALNPDTLPFNDPKSTRKVAIVTGANSGLGYFVTLHLYLHGWNVYMACRNTEKAKIAAQEITDEAQKRLKDLPQSKPGAIYILKVDLADMEDVVRSVDQFKTTENTLEYVYKTKLSIKFNANKSSLLINNAGVMAVPFELTKDGYDVQLQVNHLGPYLFTQKLLPFLKNSENKPRIVFVSSLVHHIGGRNLNYDVLYNSSPDIMWTMFRYGRSKLANIHSAAIISDQEPKILCLAAHPGVALHTNLTGYWANKPLIGAGVRLGKEAIHSVIGVSNEQGSYPTLHAALDPAYTASDDKGKYIGPQGLDPNLSSKATSKQHIKITQDWTEKELKRKGYL